MKKLVLMFAAVAAISFASCENKKAEAPVEAADSAAVVDSAATDSAAADSAAADTTAADTAK